jgi:AcrR family transcriptional regulator
VPRSRNDEAQRERLSEAVFTTLADLGPAGLTLRSVAARAGCTTGLVLHTFSNKQALLLHARDVLHQRTKKRADLLESGAADPGAAVRAVTLGALPTDSETLAEARVWVGFLAAALGDPVLTEHHAVRSRAFTDRLTRLLDATTSLAEDIAAVRASALAAAVEGISTLAAGDPEHWPAPRQRAAMEVVLDAVL